MEALPSYQFFLTISVIHSTLIMYVHTIHTYNKTDSRIDAHILATGMPPMRSEELRVQMRIDVD